MRNTNPFSMALGGYPEWGDYALIGSCIVLIVYSLYLGWWTWTHREVRNG